MDDRAMAGGRIREQMAVMAGGAPGVPRRKGFNHA
jgi:hypothetical protein